MKSTLDLTFLREMMGNDEIIVNRFITIFKNQVPQQLLEVRNHYARHEWEHLSNVVHSLKTQFNYLGIEALAQQATHIEALVDEGRTKELAVFVNSFEQDLTTFLERLE